MNNKVYLKKDNHWLSFQNPHQIITTQKTNEVREALQTVEALVDEKKWHAVGFVSYEAAQAFDSALQVHESKNFPLIWFGLFDSPTSLKSLNGLSGLTSQMWKPDIDKTRYNNVIQKIKEYIADGKTYQVNYTMRLLADEMPDAWTLFTHLAAGSVKMRG